MYICFMRKFWIILFFLIISVKLQAQDNKDTADLKYLEDQLYLSLTYNVLTSKPNLINQNGFSGGVSFGFIKDIPLNKQRNIGFAIGVGYAYDVYIQNLKITRENQTTVFQLAQDYNTNRFGVSALEVPLEIRWRNSTPQRYKFLRVYGGIKVSYILTTKTKYSDNTEILNTRNISEFNKIQYGLTLATGYGTWNLYMYYGLTPFFKDVSFNSEELNMKNFNIGLKFYIM